MDLKNGKYKNKFIKNSKSILKQQKLYLINNMKCLKLILTLLKINYNY